MKYTILTGMAICAVSFAGQFAQAQVNENNGNFTLQILHASDLEGGVNAIGRAAYFAAIIDGLEDTYPNTIRLSAGDNYIPGPFFNAASDPSIRPVLRSVTQDYFGIAGPTDIREASGRVDISIANIIGLDASALGNHEFDAGTPVVQELIGPLLPGLSVATSRWYGTQFPYLSANLDFSADPLLAPLYTSTIQSNEAFKSTPFDLPAAAAAKKIAPATLIERDGELIGVVGATTQILATISSPAPVQETTGGANNMPALAAVLQPVINDLIALGANKIILVSHLQQFAFEQALAGLLSGVDIIIAGGSDAILANPGTRLDAGSVAIGPYPFVSQDANGNPVLIVSTDGEYSYVGRLVVEFDPNGVIVLTSLDPSINGPYIADLEMVEEVWSDDLVAAFAPNTKYDLVNRLTNAVLAVVIAKDGNITGKTDVFLDGRRSQVRTQETNLGNLSADANLFVAKQFDPTTTVSIKNGGGIRAAIGEILETSPGVFEFLAPQANPVSGKEEKEVSQLDIENSLRFNNLLSLLTLTAEGLKQIMEHGFAATAPGVTPGQFPQIGGMKVSFDPTLPAGSRVRNLVLVDEDGAPLDQVVKDGAIVGNPARAIRIVTLNFLAGGGDAYPFPALGSNRIDLNTVGLPAGDFTFAIPGSEQDALAEYLFSNFSETPYNEAETDTDLDERIQILTDRDDEVLVFCIDGIFAAPGNPRVVQSSLNNFVVVRWNPAPGSKSCTVQGGKVGGPMLTQVVNEVGGGAPDRLRVPKSILSLGQLHYFNVTCTCSFDPLISSPTTQNVFFIPLGNQPPMMVPAEMASYYEGITISETGLSVFPNPSNGTGVQVALTGANDDTGVLEVFDMTGKLVLSRNVAGSYEQLISLDVPLASGVYNVVYSGSSQRLNKVLMVR